MRRLPGISETEATARIRLIRSENVGPITFKQLLTQFGSAQSALDTIPDLARRGGRARPLKIAPKSLAEDECAATIGIGAETLHLGVDGYPEALEATDGAPALLHVLGHVHLLHAASVGIVGGRAASVSGRSLASTLAQDIGAAGYGIVSGMARGIDAAAHKSALATGTIAAMAGGVDCIFPPENTDLYHEIKDRGTLVSEEPPGMKPLARHFPKRNRIISGLSLGVVVLEAKARSGTLITARAAADQGRLVFAVPGAPGDPRSEGANTLIRDGATLVRSAEDVICELHPLTGTRLAEREDSSAPFDRFPTEVTLSDKERRAVHDGLSNTPIALDALAEALELSVAKVQIAVLELELAGRAHRSPFGVVRL